MRQPLVVGNWKMHGSRAENARLIEEMIGQFPAAPAALCVVCPPLVYLQDVARLLRGSAILLGAQTLCADTQGAFTGEVSAAMLKDVGCSYVIVGHSERRLLFRESDQTVARKFVAAQAKGLVPILCVGEQLAEREAERTHEVVARQLEAVLKLASVESLATAVLAYEPVWAIGTGRNATPEQAQAVHAFIRAQLAARDAKIAPLTRILYGGSVKAVNAAELIRHAGHRRRTDWRRVVEGGRVYRNLKRCPCALKWKFDVAHDFDDRAGVLIGGDYCPGAPAAWQRRGSRRRIRRRRLGHGVRRARCAHRAVARDRGVRGHFHDQQPRARVHGPASGGGAEVDSG
jgi:triosephosphate isomerase